MASLHCLKYAKTKIEKELSKKLLKYELTANVWKVVQSPQVKPLNSGLKGYGISTYMS